MRSCGHHAFAHISPGRKATQDISAPTLGGGGTGTVYMKIAEYLSKAMMLRMPAIKRFLYSWSNQQFVVQSWQGSC
jgi:hypothetical protein